MRIFEAWFWKRYWLLFVFFVILFSILNGFSAISILISLFFTWLISKIRTILRKQRSEGYRINVRHKRFRKFRRAYRPHFGLGRKFKGRINLNYLPHWMKKKADIDFERRLAQWKKKHQGKKPTRNEMYRLAINSSHDTLPKTRGNKGHMGRQKIRKRILEGRGVVKHYQVK